VSVSVPVNKEKRERGVAYYNCEVRVFVAFGPANFECLLARAWLVLGF